jgi:hypothetical protein
MSTWDDAHEVEVYSLGICAASVCAPKAMTCDEVIARVNVCCPTGISSDWQKSSDPTFKGGESHPCTCESDSTRQHWLLVC